jgi:hypothetical protein
MTRDPYTFVRALRRLVLDEALTTRQTIFQTWSQPLAARVSSGHAIEAQTQHSCHQGQLS